MVPNGQFVASLCYITAIPLSDHWKVVFENDVKMVVASGSMLLRCVTARYPSTGWSKYSNCTVNPSKYGKENQGIHFHHHRQACLIHYFGWEQTPSLTHTG